MHWCIETCAGDLQQNWTKWNFFNFNFLGLYMLLQYWYLEKNKNFCNFSTKFLNNICLKKFLVKFYTRSGKWLSARKCNKRVRHNACFAFQHVHANDSLPINNYQTEICNVLQRHDPAIYWPRCHKAVISEYLNRRRLLTTYM